MLRLPDVPASLRLVTLLGSSSALLWKRRDLPGSWGTLRAHALLSDPGGMRALTLEDDFSSGELLFPAAFAVRRCLIPALGRWLAASRHAHFAFRLHNGVGFHVMIYLGAQSHGLFARCLRFAAFLPGAPVVRPRKTRLRLVVTPYRAGSASRWVPYEVSGPSTSLPPHPGLAWRTAHASCSEATPK